MVNSLPHRPDKRDTDWSECNTNKGTYPLVNVKMSPDPPVEGQTDIFTVSEIFSRISMQMTNVI